MRELYKELEKTIGYSFKNKGLLKHALTHSSYTFENQIDVSKCNERLEFLGDAVLELISSEYIFNTYPMKSEGEMSRFRASLVCEESLSVCAKEIKLGEYLLLSKGEELNGGRIRPSVTSDAFEALIGAIFLDGGIESARSFVERYVLNDIENKNLFYDSKTILQEYSQRVYKCTPTYRVVSEYGPEHQKTFVCDVIINDKAVGRGSGTNKKSAQQHAAYAVLVKIKDKSR